VVTGLFTVASYTYGPLLGLFAFGIFTKINIKDKYVWVISIISIALCYLLNYNSKDWFDGYSFGFELLFLNGLFTFIGLFFIQKKD
jgi:hypothetical protein